METTTKIQKIKIELIKENPENPRIIKDNKFKKLVKSIKDFPEMLNIRPIVVDENMVILGGNMRLKACQKAGLKDVPIIIFENLSEERKKEFIVKDNVGYGEWDFNILNSDWDKEILFEWGMDLPKFETFDDEDNEKTDDRNINIENLFQLTIDFNNELELKEAYEKLTAEGYITKILMI